MIMNNQIKEKWCKYLLLFIFNNTIQNNLYFRSKFEAIPDNMTPDDILKQAQNAAKLASEKLATKNTKVSLEVVFNKKNK